MNAQSEAERRYPDHTSPGPLDHMSTPEEVVEDQREAFVAGVEWVAEKHKAQIKELEAAIERAQSELGDMTREIQNREYHPDWYA